MLTKTGISEENNKSGDVEVNEATAALKGLLGIGGGGIMGSNGPIGNRLPNASRPLSPPTPLAVYEEELMAAAAAAAAKDQVAGGSSSKQPNNNTVNNTIPRGGATGDMNKKNNKNKNKKKKPQIGGPPGMNKQQEVVEDESPAMVSGKKQPKRKNAIPTNSSSIPPKKDENFAWSAFQSSPDASTLPIPAFASPAVTDASRKAISASSDIKQIIPAAPALATDAMSRLAGDSKVTKDDGKVSNQDGASAGDVVGRAMAKDAASEPAALTNPDVGGGEKGDSKSSEKADDSPSTAPVSKTGVNLAAALAADSEPTLETGVSMDPTNPPHALSPQQQHHPQQAPLHVPPGHYGANPLHLQHQPQHQPHHLPMSYQHQQIPPQYMQQQQSHYHHHAAHQYGHQQHHQYLPPPPPGYITIQVQIPPVLMPGRQMVVTSPAGYPVQVVVPEGIPPGMIIPVHVPIGPPMHMMPQHGQQHHGHPPPQHAQQQQQQQHNNYGGRYYNNHHNNNNHNQNHQNSNSRDSTTTTTTTASPVSSSNNNNPKESNNSSSKQQPAASKK